MHPASLPYLYRLMRTQWFSRDRLEIIQWRKLKGLLHHAYQNVPYYRDLFDSAGISPADIRVPADIQQIPVTDKNTLSSLPASEILAKDIDAQRCISRTTSGTTGMPLRLFLSYRQKEAQDMTQARALLSNGLKLTHRRAVFVTPRHIPAGKHWFQRLGIWRKQYYSVFEDTTEQFDRLAKFAPDCLVGTPAILDLLASASLKRGTQLRPKLIFSSADILDSATRQRLETTFNAQVIDLYGSLEFGYMAWECERKCGFHINMENILMEFPDAENSDYAEGVICTNLLATAMPLIRYRLGDICIPHSKPCECGRGLPLIKLIAGRCNDVARLPGGRIITPQALADIMVAFHSTIRQFKIVQKTKYHFRVLLLGRPGCEGRLSNDVERALRQVLGAQVSIAVEFVDAIPNDRSGKRRAIVSELDAG